MVHSLVVFSAGKSSVLMDVKPWDDETDMKMLEEAVRNVKMEGLLWGACMILFPSFLDFVFILNIVQTFGTGILLIVSYAYWYLNKYLL